MCVRTQIAQLVRRQTMPSHEPFPTTPKELHMTLLLHISASPRGAASESLALAETFLTTYQDLNPNVEIETWNLWNDLPEFGPAAAAAKMAVFAGADLNGDEAAAWRDVIATFERFDAADLYLFSVPMWNASVPYKLKQFIDVVSQPGMVFGFDPVDGYTGLLRDKKAAVVYTSAIYGPGRGPSFGGDFQAPFFRDWLTWAGVEDVTEVRFGPNIATIDADAAREVAQAQTRQVAKTF
jgi:FMN-dependent NADH-azoreductase